MRPILLTTALALSLVAAPAAANPEPVSQPCAAVEGVDHIVTADGLETVIDTPTLLSPYPTGLGGEPDPAGFQDAATEVHRLLLDVNPDAVSANLDLTFAWEHTGDVDVDVYDANGTLMGESHSFNPLDGNTEFVSLGRLAHCTVLDVHVRNYMSTPGDIDLIGTVSKLRAE